MNFNEYQKRASSTAIYPSSGMGIRTGIAYCALKLAGEAGEVAQKVGKYYYRGDVVPSGHTVRELLMKELGGTLWYIAQMCTELGVSLDEVAEINLAQLADRAKRGVIKGSGDDR